MKCNFAISRSLVILAGLSAAANAMAVIQDSVTFSNFSPAQLGSANITSGTLKTNVFTVPGYTLGRIYYSGDTTEINGVTNDFFSDHRFRVVYPGGSPLTEVVLTGSGYTGTATFSGSFFLNPGAAAPFGGGTWNFYFINTIDDSPTGIDTNVNYTFSLSDEPLVPPTTVVDYNPLADGLVSNSQSYAAAQVRWYKMVVPTATGLTRFLDIDTETSTTNTAATAIGVYNSLGQLVVSDTVDGSASLSQISFGGQANPRPAFQTGANAFGVAYNGRDGNLAAGTYYIAVSRTTTTFGANYGVTSTSTGTATLSLRINYNTVSGVPTPPTATDLGILTVGTNSQVFSNTASQVKWFKFELDAAANQTRFLDIDMNNSNNGTIDYDFALYNSAGTPISYVDGKASSYEPALSYGGESVPRAPLTNTFAFAGQSGLLPVGTYYLAVARFALTPGNYFQATTSGTGVGTNLPVRFTLGDIVVPAAIRYVQPMSAINNTPNVVNNMSDVYGILVTPDFSDRQVADDFTVGGTGWTVNLVEGSFTRNGGDAAVAPTAVTVTFYQKTAGLPGAVVSTETVAAYTVQNGGYFGNTSSIQRYRVPITPVNLTAGDYFVMVQPNSTINNFWFASSPDTAIAGSPAVFQKGAASTGPTDATYPASWTLSGNSPFLTPMDLALKIEGTVNAPAFTASGIVDFGNVGPTYNTGPFPGSIPVSFRDASNAEVATGTASYNAVTGAFSASVPGAVVGPYRISFKLGFWLRKTMPNPADPAAPLGNYDFGTVAPAVGDADDDNEITNADYSIWAFGNGNSVAPNTDADFDGDGEITNSDYALWAGNNGLSGDN